MPHPVYIKGFGCYVPERVLDNFELAAMVDTSNEWILERTGIKERRIAAPGQTCSDMICRAARQAMDAAGCKAEDITHLLVGTVSGDDAFPATAVRVQQKLGITGMAFDLSAACTGFIYGLHLARGLLAIEPHAKILVTAGEVLSMLTNWEDRATCVLFGDGAGAAVLSAEEAAPCMEGDTPLTVNARIEDVLCNADGELSDILFCNGAGSSFPYKLGDVVGPENFIQMNGRELFKHAVRSMSSISTQLLEKLGYSLDDIDLVVPHQANLRIITAVAERLGVPQEKVFINVHKYGNTSAVSTILGMSEALQQGVIRPGMRVLINAFGAGLTWGAAVLKF